MEEMVSINPQEREDKCYWHIFMNADSKTSAWKAYTQMKRAGIQELNLNRPTIEEKPRYHLKYPFWEEELSGGEPDSSGMKKVLLGESEVFTSDTVIIDFNFC